LKTVRERTKVACPLYDSLYDSRQQAVLTRNSPIGQITGIPAINELGEA